MLLKVLRLISTHYACSRSPVSEVPRLLRPLHMSPVNETNFSLGSYEKFQPRFRDEKRPKILGTSSGTKGQKSNTAAKRLRMRQIEHFRSLFQSHFPVKVSRALHSVCSLWFSCSALCCSCFCFVVIEIAFMDSQAQITETISRLDSEKVR